MIAEFQAGEFAPYPTLVELSGDLGPELMGRGLVKRFVKKTAKATGHAVAATGRVAARHPVTAIAVTGGLAAVPVLAQKRGRSNLVGKKSGLQTAARVTRRNAGDIAIAATVVPTAGLSLLGKKSVRKGVGTAARATQHYALRPAAHGVATVARSKAVQAAAGAGLRAGLSALPGGGVASGLFSALPDPLKRAARAGAQAYQDADKHAPDMPTPAAADAAAAEEGHPLWKNPWVLGGGALAALGAVYLVARKRG